MSSQNNESGLVAMGLATFGIAFLIVAAVFVAYIVGVIALATILSLFAWRNPLHIGSITITPDEAHGLIGCGGIGMVLIPVILLIGDLFGVNVNWGWWHGYFIGGYIAGAASFLWSLEQEASASAPANPPVARQVTPATLPPAASAPFRYASWNDEER